MIKRKSCFSVWSFQSKEAQIGVEPVVCEILNIISLGFWGFGYGSTPTRPRSSWGMWARWPSARRIGTLALIIKQELLLVIVGGLFVMEAISVILQVTSYKLRDKKRIFRCAPIHHHFEMGGWKETQVVIRFWILAILFALMGLATLKIR